MAVCMIARLRELRVGPLLSARMASIMRAFQSSTGSATAVLRALASRAAWENLIIGHISVAAANSDVPDWIFKRFLKIGPRSWDPGRARLVLPGTALYPWSPWT